jgi:hypothetical protein
MGFSALVASCGDERKTEDSGAAAQQGETGLRCAGRRVGLAASPNAAQLAQRANVCACLLLAARASTTLSLQRAPRRGPAIVRAAFHPCPPPLHLHHPRLPPTRAHPSTSTTHSPPPPCPPHLRVVVRHGGEEVVCDVRVRDVVVQGVEQPAVVAVHRGQRTPQPVPLVVAVVRQLCEGAGGLGGVVW